MMTSVAGRAVTVRARAVVAKRDVRTYAATQKKGAAKSAANAGRTLWLPNTVRAVHRQAAARARRRADPGRAGV